MENPDGTLRIDMTAQVSVLLKQAKGVLMVPAVALGPKSRDGERIVRIHVQRNPDKLRHMAMALKPV